MNTRRLILALAVLSPATAPVGCAWESAGAESRSGSPGRYDHSRDVDGGPQARNASPYMRQ